MWVIPSISVIMPTELTYSAKWDSGITANSHSAHAQFFVVQVIPTLQTTIWIDLGDFIWPTFSSFWKRSLKKNFETRLTLDPSLPDQTTMSRSDTTTMRALLGRKDVNYLLEYYNKESKVNNENKISLQFESRWEQIKKSRMKSGAECSSVSIHTYTSSSHHNHTTSIIDENDVLIFIDDDETFHV